MKYAPIESLRTQRLLLRKLEPGDAAALFERVTGDKKVTEYMLFQPHRDAAETAGSIRKVLARYETGRGYRWGIVLGETSQLIGIIDLLRFDETDSSCSFAYMLGSEFWGRGYGTEALTAALDFAFSRMEMERVDADHFAENPASGAVMRKAGMAFQGVAPGKYEKDGIAHDAVQYQIDKRMWAERKTAEDRP